jgi:hypothetical protein
VKYIPRRRLFISSFKMRRDSCEKKFVHGYAGR